MTPVVPPATPLNSNVVAGSASRLGLTVHETPASVDVVSQQTMQEQGYRTTSETVKGAAGVDAIDAAGAPAGFSMRGFTFGEVNVLYNGISTGPQSITSRVMDTFNLDQVEFLKGPSSLMSGLNAIGGAVNYVNRQPTSGPIKNELDGSFDSLGTYRTHFGSGGSTLQPGLDYRFDITQSKDNSFIDGDFRNLSNVSGQLNYQVTNDFKTFVAIEYKNDNGHAYWGTPLVPTAFAGPNAISGVVSGTAFSAFSGNAITPVTIDSRTLHTNYNIADNSTGGQELWLRSGFEWTPLSNVTIKNQMYIYNARRHWIDSETYAFDDGSLFAPNTIDRDRFFVTHNQQLVGDNVDFKWDSNIHGMPNTFATQLQVSQNFIRFTEENNFDDGSSTPGGLYPADSVSVINPDPGTYLSSGGVSMPAVRDKKLDTAAASFEDRLKVTPWLSLIGGVRFEHLSLQSSGFNSDGSAPTPFTKTWDPIPYRAAVTIEPFHNLMFYAMTATAYDPAAAGIFSISPGSSLELTSARLYEAGVKHLFWNDRAEWSFAAYDIKRNNVYVQIDTATFALAGEIATKGVEFSAAVRPIDNLKLWGNVALTEAKYVDFDFSGFTGNTPSNVAPLIINAGASYRFDTLRWPVEIGASVRHVGQRFVFEDDATKMEPYTVADAYAFVDIAGREFSQPKIDNVRVAFRVRNLTNTVYAAFSDPGYPDQVYLGFPRTYEVSTSFRW